MKDRWGRMVWLRSVGAVVAGFLAVAVVSEATDFALQTLLPDYDLRQGLTAPMYVLAAAQRTLWGVAGGFVAARLAPHAAMAHALALGAIGAALNVVGLIAMWRVGDHWYPIVLAVTAIPSTWVGGRIAGKAMP